MKQFFGELKNIKNNTIWFAPKEVVDVITLVKSNFGGIQVFYNGKEVKRLLVEVDKDSDKRKQRED